MKRLRTRSLISSQLSGCDPCTINCLFLKVKVNGERVGRRAREENKTNNNDKTKKVLRLTFDRLKALVVKIYDISVGIKNTKIAARNGHNTILKVSHSDLKNVKRKLIRNL